MAIRIITLHRVFMSGERMVGYTVGINMVGPEAMSHLIASYAPSYWNQAGECGME